MRVLKLRICLWSSAGVAVFLGEGGLELAFELLDSSGGFPVHPTIWGDFEMPDWIGIYEGMAPMRPLTGLEEAPDRDPRPRADTPWAHRRPGYSLAGGFPAEPASASPGSVIAADRRISGQVWDIGVIPQEIHPVTGHPPKIVG